MAENNLEKKTRDISLRHNEISKNDAQKKDFNFYEKLKLGIKSECKIFYAPAFISFVGMFLEYYEYGTVSFSLPYVIGITSSATILNYLLGDSISKMPPEKQKELMCLSPRIRRKSKK